MAKAHFMFPLALSIALAAGAAAAQGTFERLAARLPIEADRDIYFADLAAARRQGAPYAGGLSPDQRAIMPVMPLVLPPAFARSGIPPQQAKLTAALGFDLDAIEAMAGWGVQDRPLVVAGPAARADGIDAALRTRGFTPRKGQGARLWVRSGDYAYDNDLVENDPISQYLSSDQIFAIRDGLLYSARSEEVMAALLGDGPRLSDDPDAAAILRAGYALADARGDLLDAILIREVPIAEPSMTSLIGGLVEGKIEDADALAEEMRKSEEAPARTLPRLPPYAIYGLLLWQDGLDLTGAVAIPYRDPAHAEAALAAFEARLAVVQSPEAKKPFDVLLPADRDFRVVEAGGRHLLVLSFHEVADIGDAEPPRLFRSHPQTRLYSMWLYRELPLLIGVAG